MKFTKLLANWISWAVNFVLYTVIALYVQQGAVICDPQRNECKVTLIGEEGPQITKGIRLFLVGNLQRRAHS